MISFDCKIDKKYNIEGEFNSNSSVVNSLLSNSQQYIYGEFGIPENYDISLKGVSHIINEIIPNNGKVKIKGRILNTTSGKLLKNLVDEGFNDYFCFYVRYVKNSNGGIGRIFTFDIDDFDKFTDTVEILRSERKLKLEILKGIWEK